MNKEKMLSDWMSFCEKKKNFDKSHFYTLFHYRWQPSELKIIFKYFADYKVLEEKIMRYLNSDRYNAIQKGNNFKTIPIDENKLVTLIKSDLSEKKKVCQKFKDFELVDIIEHAKIEFVSVEDFTSLLETDIPDGWIIELLNDYFIENRISNEDSIYALFEAYYGLTANYQLVWFLGSPLINVEYNFNSYIELWENGLDYLVGHNHVFVIRNK